MWKYEKRLQYPVNIRKRNLKLAKCILTQYGGPAGELAAAWQYLDQRYNMPDDRGKSLLTDICPCGDHFGNASSTYGRRNY